MLINGHFNDESFKSITTFDRFHPRGKILKLVSSKLDFGVSVFCIIMYVRSKEKTYSNLNLKYP